jgi:hypothetical protein
MSRAKWTGGVAQSCKALALRMGSPEFKPHYNPVREVQLLSALYVCENQSQRAGI